MARILVVEPHRPLRTFLAGVLVDFGHHVAQCPDLQQAREALRRAVFDVLVSDLVQGVAASEFAPWAPPLRVISLIGRPMFAAGDDRYGRAARLYDKPFRVGDLKRLVAGCR